MKLSKKDKRDIVLSLEPVPTLAKRYNVCSSYVYQLRQKAKEEDVPVTKRRRGALPKNGTWVSVNLLTWEVESSLDLIQKKSLIKFLKELVGENG